MARIIQINALQIQVRIELLVIYVFFQGEIGVYRQQEYLLHQGYFEVVAG